MPNPPGLAQRSGQFVAVAEQNDKAGGRAGLMRGAPSLGIFAPAHLASCAHERPRYEACRTHQESMVTRMTARSASSNRRAPTTVVAEVALVGLVAT
jgi:hypothetical protein